MSNRKRVNISIDPETYERLQQMKHEHGFKNVCELLVAFVRILLDRLEAADNRRYDLPDDEGEYIDDMFNDLGSTYNRGDDIPVRKRK